MAHKQCECKPASRPFFSFEQKKNQCAAFGASAVHCFGKNKRRGGKITKKKEKTKPNAHHLGVRSSLCDTSSTNLAGFMQD